MNKCDVRFVCKGTSGDCKYFEYPEGDDPNHCLYCDEDECLCKKAQIDALKDEGFDIKEGGE